MYDASGEREESKKLTRPSLNSRHIVFGNIILNPFPVFIILFASSGMLGVVVEAARNRAVANEAWRQCHLECEPVGGLSYVEDVAAVCNTGCLEG